jgi:glycosyltransferase involved in cell wall biosynthesis
MKLGFICETTANAYYRAILPMRALERRGHSVHWPSNTYNPPLRELLDCDLVHCYRRTDRLEDLRKLSARGIAISFDNDDNYAVAEVSEKGAGLEGRRHNNAIFRDILKASKLADVTTTPNETLAEYYRSIGAENVTVIENHLEEKMFGFGLKSKHPGIVVGWIAGIEHEPDLKRIPVADALSRLLQTHPELRILTVGVPLPLRSERYEHLKEVDFLELLKITSRIDIGIAPLADTAFNRCRSNVKLKEYASGGTPWLASPVGPYLGLGEDQGGLHVADEDWLAAIDTLIRDQRMRKRLAKRALRWAKAQTIQHHVHTWETALHGAIERRQQRTN